MFIFIDFLLIFVFILGILYDAFFPSFEQRLKGWILKIVKSHSGDTCNHDDDLPFKK